MAAHFFATLSQNYIELLEDDEYYDITIEVGEDPYVKIFRAHMNILCYRSPYLRRVLATNKKNNDGTLAHIKLPKISPEIFEIILMYIYGGILSLNEQVPSDILKVLVAADELCLQELTYYLQKYLIENKSEWMMQNFELAHQTSFQSDNLVGIQQFCTNLMAKSPEKIFNSFDFTSLSEKSLIKLIKSDNLQMKEIEVWEYVLKWGLAQNPTLILDPDTWKDDDFDAMKNTLQHCLPLIRFYCLSSKEFVQKVRPYKKLLNHQLYEDLVNSYMDPDNEPTENILLPRNIRINSKIIDLRIISTISRWIDKKSIDNKFAYIRELYLPYEFKLLLRGSQDGFTPNKFHELCDGKSHTVTFIKVRGTNEIIGGYNPLIWKSSNEWGVTNDSFIFSFNSNDIFFNEAIISNIEVTNSALYFNRMGGPYFGDDIIIYSSNEYTNYDDIYYQWKHYEKRIRNNGNFTIEDYEIFQLIRK
ncbi:hypothetical protein RclHR1_00100036 [Rhizophagus clarus]|uniref:BTB domain-containing protein n=1 Tax=Rhizophagus clarus TaxID=94130 RepID=A0A2Z6Q505_9GLOM|nr:hypothetical protein RclHR1_00100036 [Rhizophagus clarus]GES93621.1 hypothetical protein GLOIN_2v1782772 [Rhizophagus clarus]